jgi:hypothetical protein
MKQVILFPIEHFYYNIYKILLLFLLFFSINHIYSYDLIIQDNLQKKEEIKILTLTENNLIELLDLTDDNYPNKYDIIDVCLPAYQISTTNQQIIKNFLAKGKGIILKDDTAGEELRKYRENVSILFPKFKDFKLKGNSTNLAYSIKDRHQILNNVTRVQFGMFTNFSLDLIKEDFIPILTDDKSNIVSFVTNFYNGKVLVIAMNESVPLLDKLKEGIKTSEDFRGFFRYDNEIFYENCINYLSGRLVEDKKEIIIDPNKKDDKKIIDDSLLIKNFEDDKILQRKLDEIILKHETLLKELKQFKIDIENRKKEN